jgi:hypothetical protein
MYAFLFLATLFYDRTGMHFGRLNDPEVQRAYLGDVAVSACRTIA